MAPNADDHDAAALRDRVKQLEQTVAEQQATIESLQQPPASRRGVLAALTGVAGAGALGAYSQRGSAQAAGQVGTQSEPVDVFANTIDANEVGTGEASIGEVAVRAALTTDQSIAGDGSDVQVNLDISSFADNDVLTADLSNNKLTVNADGTYYIYGQLTWRDDANWSQGDIIRVSINSAGNRNAIFESEVITGGNRRSLPAVDAIKLSAGDDIFMEARQDSGSAIDLTGTDDRTYIQVVRIG